MPLQATSGAASYDAFGGGVAVVPTYIEDVFSTWLYTGNSSTQSIVNGIDLSGKGGLVWIKNRTFSSSHGLVDTVRGRSKVLFSNATTAEQTSGAGDDVTAFLSNGFSVGASYNFNCNASDSTYASWTFRKQPKFYTQGTFTGDGTTNKVITHDLGGTTGFIIVKRTDSTGNWQTWHRTFTAKQTIFLNTTDAKQTYSGADDITVTNTSFTVGTNQIFGNASGATYVYYVFAHDAGGFGLTGTDNVISCGSVTLDGSGNATVNLGYEPQWVMIKRSDNTSTWYMHDTMRGLDLTTYTRLYANTSAAEDKSTPTYIAPSSTGFNLINGFSSASSTWIYIAIRRGPMKVPTTGTSVYKSSLLAGNSSTQQITDLDFPPDLVMTKARNTSYGNRWTDRLRGFGRALRSDDVGAELDNTTSGVNPFNMNGYTVLSGNPYNQSGFNYVNHAMRRAPSFMDVVCWTTTQTGFGITAITHNLGVVPQLIITKARNTSGNWMVRVEGVTGNTSYLRLNSTDALTTFTLWGTPTTTTFSEDEFGALGSAGTTAVAYLFATCAGVSKVGSYTGNGSTQTINCGFTGGARFVLIKATSTTGDWMVSDSARGIIAGSDPYLELNNTNAEVTGEDWLDTDSTGFVVNEVSGSNANTNGATYIFLAIA